jgi:GTP-binding protein HflX
MEKCILVALRRRGEAGRSVDASLDELASLVSTAGGEAVARIVQQRAAPDPATYLGRGKARQLKDLATRLEASTLVVDGDLRPAQEAELSRITGLKIVERTGLILDIFAQHARSAEGKVQVRLAQLQYRLGRLSGKGSDLSRLGGGIGTRGPGEQKLEEDRRRIRQQIARLSNRLEKIDRTRQSNRKRRLRAGVPVVALVGYTNAGKSTLLNRLTGSDVLVEDKLFSTLDPHTGRLYVASDSCQAVLIDTVGFVRNLPLQLVRAFKATLDEILTADLLVHVVDLSSSEAAMQIRAVREILDEIGAGDIDEIVAFNKSDLIGTDPYKVVDRLLRESQTPSSTSWVLISAASGAGIESLRQAISAKLSIGGRPREALATSVTDSSARLDVEAEVDSAIPAI